MPYGRVYNKSTVTTKGNYVKMEGEGEARSNDIVIAREISSDLAGTIDRANRIAYRAHKESRSD